LENNDSNEFGKDFYASKSQSISVNTSQSQPVHISQFEEKGFRFYE